MSLGECLEKLGALVEDTRDENGLQRFTHYNLEQLFSKRDQDINVLKNHDYYPLREVLNYRIAIPLLQILISL